jgi:hypothetical protein
MLRNIGSAPGINAIASPGMAHVTAKAKMPVVVGDIRTPAFLFSGGGVGPGDGCTGSEVNVLLGVFAIVYPT